MDETLSVNFADDALAQKSVTAYSHMTGSQYDKKAATADNFIATNNTTRRERSTFKGPTNDKNDDFEETLKRRMEAAPKDFNHLQKEKLKSMSTGKPPKERMNIPEGVEVFMYGNQKLNIWEFQKE